MKPGALLLTPGAGNDASHSSLVAIEEAVDVPVARVDFPYRREGRKAPDRPPKLIACIREEAEALVKRAKADPASLVLGGRSMGGRMCSRAVAEGLPAAGLVLIAYPLHPPGKPEKLRVDHFGDLTVPCLFICGTKDPFGTPDELEGHASAIPGPVTHHWVEGKRHDLRGADEEIAATVTHWLARLT